MKCNFTQQHSDVVCVCVSAQWTLSTKEKNKVHFYSDVYGATRRRSAAYTSNTPLNTTEHHFLCLLLINTKYRLLTHCLKKHSRTVGASQISHYTHYILTLHILWFTGLNETLTFYTKQKWAITSWYFMSFHRPRLNHLEDEERI